ncbi:MAG TPA: hypothetical protein VND93_20485, partial [Myxococcales bacterium]|nr:hypothetical protein [Myxococcales bacterium]
ISGIEAKFLRKAALAIGQQELGRCLGVSRPTVARWEGDSSLSAEHDLQLRNHVVLHLLRLAQFPGTWKKHRSELLRLVRSGAIEGARTAEAPRKLPPLRLAA